MLSSQLPGIVRIVVSGAGSVVHFKTRQYTAPVMTIARTNFILYVRDQRASADFYRRVFAAEPILDVPGMSEFNLGDDVVLGLMPELGITRLLDGAVDPAAAGGVPRAELYLLVDDAAAYHARALAAGGKELSPLQVRDWGEAVAYCQDPDGHVLAFARLLADQKPEDNMSLEINHGC